MTDRKIDDLLQKRHRHHTPLGRLIHDSTKHQAWTDAVRSLLPATLAAEVAVVNFRAQTLVLQASNASFATRLRYLLPELTIKLRILGDFQALDGVRITVNQSQKAPPPAPIQRRLSAASAENLANFAKSLGTKYVDLEAAFLRLSKQSAPFSGNRDEVPRTPNQDRT